MPRIEYNNGVHATQQPKKFQNYISTTLYHFYDFLPRSLWNQVSRVTNIYFIIQCVISFFPAISTISVSSAVLPVVFIIFFSLAFDLGEDFMRYLKDRQTNRRKASVLRAGAWERVEYQHVQPGDIVRVLADHEACADLLLLSFRSSSPYAYIETANLDGEKNLKPRVPVLDRFLTETDLLETFPNFEVDYQPPIEFLERFDGNFLATHRDGRRVETRLGIGNFLPRTCLLRNTESVIGLVVYAGRDTKIMKNTKDRRVKVSKMETKMNYYIVVLIVLLLAALFIMATYAVLSHKNGFDFQNAFFVQEYSYGTQWVITVLRYFVIMNTIVPISLIVTLQIAKMVMSWFYLLEKKQDKIRVRINTMNIHEELGQIDYVLSDKTGTLTENKMVLRHFQTRHKSINVHGGKVSVDGDPFLPFQLRSADGQAAHAVEEEGDMDFLYFVALNTCHECFAESKKEPKPEPKAEKDSVSAQTISVSEPRHNSSKFISDKELRVRPGVVLTEECSGDNQSHSVQMTPRKPEPPLTPLSDGFGTPEIRTAAHENFRTNFKNFPQAPDTSRFVMLQQSIEIQGPSPDEIAILRASKNFCGYLFKGATATETIIMDKEGFDIEVKVLQTNKFNSMRKMMSVVAEIGGVIFVLAKGADSMVISKLAKDKTEAEAAAEALIHQRSDLFVLEGLRVMYVAAKVISRQQWSEIETRLRQANQTGHYDDQMAAIQADLESDLTLIGATAIEDRLQANLRTTIEQIQTANIKMWMITGDKLETAENIAYASGLFKRSRQLVVLRALSDLALADNPPDQNLIIDGEFFGEVLHEQGQVMADFRRTIMNYQNVVFSRTNANQKVEVVKIVNSYGKTTLAIGDGANDVNMIQEAHVGVGIYGHEGKQASNAADFSITRFADLSELLFNHGRLSYNRVSDLIMFFFYKNFMFTVPQFIYAFYCDFSGTLVYTEWYISLYNLLFTSFVASARSVYNKDVYGYGDRNNRLIEIHTYYLGRHNRGLNPRNFCLWLVGGIAEVTLLFYFIYACYMLHAYDGAHEASWEFMVMLMSAVIIFHQVNKISYQTNIFLIIQALFYSTGYWIFIIYFAISDSVLSLGSYKVNSQLWLVGGFWLPFAFILLVLMVLNFIYYKCQEVFCPTVFNLIHQRVERFSDKSCEETVKQCVAEAESQTTPLRWIFN